MDTRSLGQANKQAENPITVTGVMLTCNLTSCRQKLNTSESRHASSPVIFVYILHVKETRSEIEVTAAVAMERCQPAISKKESKLRDGSVVPSRTPVARKNSGCADSHDMEPISTTMPRIHVRRERLELNLLGRRFRCGKKAVSPEEATDRSSSHFCWISELGWKTDEDLVRTHGVKLHFLTPIQAATMHMVADQNAIVDR